MKILHKQFAVLIMMISVLLSSTSLFADFIVTTPDQVAITYEGIFVNFEGITQPVETITMANDGFIVAIPKPNTAICPSCGNDTYTPGRTCKTCGFPLKKSS